MSPWLALSIVLVSIKKSSPNTLLYLTPKKMVQLAPSITVFLAKKKTCVVYFPILFVALTFSIRMLFLQVAILFGHCVSAKKHTWLSFFGFFGLPIFPLFFETIKIWCLISNKCLIFSIHLFPGLGHDGYARGTFHLHAGHCLGRSWSWNKIKQRVSG